MTKLNEISFDDWDEQNNLRSGNETDLSSKRSQLTAMTQLQFQKGLTGM